MIAVSDKWQQKQRNLLAPEGYIQLVVGVSEVGLQEEVVPSSGDEALFSNINNVVDIHHEHLTYPWATNELNLWSLDGTKVILADSGSFGNKGYASNNVDTGDITLTAAEVHDQAIPGLIITWCEELCEYATNFTVTAYNGNSVVSTLTVTDNTSVQSRVELEIANYDRIKITVNEWCLPQHRARIEKIQLGLDTIYLKKDIIRFKHEQIGSAVSAELPKNSIEFSLDNSKGLWSPNNPVGQGQYLSERQEIKAYYGFDIDGTIEWTKAGTFYLSEWRTPSNGLEATFVARDILEYMIDEPYTGITSGTLLEIANAAISQADLPKNVSIVLDERLGNYSTEFDDDYTIAEVLQLCANAACCVMYSNRDGQFRIEYVANPVMGYSVRSDVSYSYPEYELSKPLKSIEITYGNENSKYSYPVSDEGEKQTLSNPFISTETQAKEVAEWIAKTLKFRKTIKGDYRADPRADVFDKIAVESKYGVNNAVLLTNIAYTFTGVFKGSYTGVVTEFSAVAAAYSGEIYAGEV